MNELGDKAPEQTPQVAAGPVAGVNGARRPYVAPAIVAFGSVQEFTRGSGSAATQDTRRTTRVRSRG